MGNPALPRVITDFRTTGMGRTTLPNLPMNSLYDSLDSTSLDWTLLDWTQLNWTGLNWTQLNWTGTATTVKYKSMPV